MVSISLWCAHRRLIEDILEKADAHLGLVPCTGASCELWDNGFCMDLVKARTAPAVPRRPGVTERYW